MIVDVERVGERIHLRSARPTPGLGKELAGARFSKQGGPHWTLPLSVEMCRALRQHFGSELRIGVELSAWARVAIAQEARIVGLGRSDDADLHRVPEVAPKLAKAMEARTYQRAGARFLAEAWGTGGAILAHEPGLGKTLMAIGGIIESGVPGPYLVLCPKTPVLSTWKPELHRWHPSAAVITVPDGRAERNAILDRLVLTPYSELANAFVVLHFAMVTTRSWWQCQTCGHRMRWRAGPKKFECVCAFDRGNPPTGHRVDEHEYPQLFDMNWGAIVADESDRLLLRQTGTPTYIRTGAELLQVRPDGARIPMSGTPWRSRPKLLWGTLNWVWPREYTGFWRWAERYWEVGSGWAGSYKIGDMEKGAEDLLYRELDRRMLRRTKGEVAKDLPPKTYVGSPLRPGDESSPVAVWLPMNPKQQKLYDQMQKQGTAILSGGTLNPIGVLAEMTRLKQFAGACGRVEEGRDGSPKFMPELPSNKFDYVVQLVEQLGIAKPTADEGWDPSTKLVIVSQWTEFLELYRQHLDPLLRQPCALLSGRVSGARRAQLVEDFNRPAGTDSPHVMMLQLQTGGVSITIDSADHMVLLDEWWIADDQVQVEDRIHRVSKPRPVFYHYLKSLGTIDEAIAETTTEQRAETFRHLDGRRGITYARKILEMLS